SPLGLSATVCTARVGPAKVFSTAPLVVFHSRTCLSTQPVSSLPPSALSAALVTTSPCARVCLDEATGTCQSLREPSREQDSTCPAGVNTRDVTAPACAPRVPVCSPLVRFQKRTMPV